MKYQIQGCKPENRLPNVGELWKHEGDSLVYMRINDSVGLAMGHEKNRMEKNFYSVCMDDGYLTYTSRTATNVFILKQVNTLELQET